MAYRLFGLHPSDYPVVIQAALASPSGTFNAYKQPASINMVAYPTGSGGVAITDLKLFTGSYTVEGSAAPGGVFATLVDGTCAVWAQDTVGQLWITQQGSGGQRWLLLPVDIHDRVMTVETGLAGKVDSTRQVNTTGPYLTGGGALTGNLTIAAVTGVSSTTLAVGNHSHGAFTTSPRPINAQVLSLDTPTEWFDAANGSDPYTFLCDGTNDEVQINLAVDAASSTRNPGMPGTAADIGKVDIGGGRFNVGAAGCVIRTGVHVEGRGPLTELRAVSCNQVGLWRLGAPDDHLTKLSNMWLNGNSTSGGTCDGVHYDMTNSVNTSDYPDSNPDSDHWIRDVFIDEFRGNARDGIHWRATGTANNRGNMIGGCQIRDCTTGNGIFLESASDCFVTECHVGGSGLSGYRINGGNTKINACKSFYSGSGAGAGAGIWLISGRWEISGFESQDDDTGFFFDGAPGVGSGLIADSALTAGIRVSTNDLVVGPFNIFNRGGIGSGIRFEVSTRGLWYDGTYTGCVIIGKVEGANITTDVQGTAPTTNSFVQVPVSP